MLRALKALEALKASKRAFEFRFFLSDIIMAVFSDSNHRRLELF